MLYRSVSQRWVKTGVEGEEVGRGAGLDWIDAHGYTDNKQLPKR